MIKRRNKQPTLLDDVLIDQRKKKLWTLSFDNSQNAEHLVTLKICFGAIGDKREHAETKQRVWYVADTLLGAGLKMGRHIVDTDDQGRITITLHQPEHIGRFLGYAKAHIENADKITHARKTKNENRKLPKRDSSTWSHLREAGQTLDGLSTVQKGDADKLLQNFRITTTISDDFFEQKYNNGTLFDTTKAASPELKNLLDLCGIDAAMVKRLDLPVRQAHLIRKAINSPHTPSMII